jgi:putative Mg2+ transporter-C (MgtC) family protein
MITEQDVIIRLIIAAFLGAIVGFERERNGQDAGLRTHIILVVGATLTMTVSINMAIQFRPNVLNGDPARLAAQVVSGIGFLGAGAIIRYGPNIKGLTTATSLWTMAVVGLAVGAGHYLAGIVATAVILFSLVLLNVIEKRFIHQVGTALLVISADDRISLLDEISKHLTKISRVVGRPSVMKNFRAQKVRVEYTIKMSNNVSVENILDDISRIEGIRSVKIS